MKYLIALLCVAVVALLFLLIHIKLQLHSLSRQLEKRLDDGSRNYLHVSLFDRSVSRLASDMNKCFVRDDQARQTLEQEEKQFRETIANISHDLRTPLTSVKGFLQLLESGQTFPDDMQARAWLTVAVRNRCRNHLKNWLRSRRAEPARPLHGVRVRVI